MTTLPIEKILFNGDPVACVVATDRYLAEDAAEMVFVDYEPLEPVASIESALAEGAPLIDESLPSNLVSHQIFSAGDPKGVAGGIAQALVTTASGLIIAIPTIVSYRYLSRRADKMLEHAEMYGHAFANALITTGQRQSAARQ